MKYKVKNVTLWVLCAFVLACFATAAVLFGSTLYPSADEEPVTADFVTIDATEMQAGYSESAVQDPVSRDITLNNGCRIGFTNIPRNLEMTATVNFSAMAYPAQICLVMRSSGNAIVPVPYADSGYAFMYYANGMYSLYDNGVDVNGGAQWGPLPEFSVGVDYSFSMKTVNLADGSGVLVSVSVNGTQIISYTDTTDPVLTEGMAGFTAQEGAAYVLKGKGVQETAAVNPTYFSEPIPIQDLALPAQNEDGSLQWAGAAAEGAGYNMQTDGFYSIKTTIAPAGGIISMSVGSFRTNANTMQLFHLLDPQWGWTDTGYHFDWANTGAITVSRSYISSDGVKSRVFSAAATGFGPGGVYEVEFGFEPVGENVVKVFLKINGGYAFIIYDSAADDGYEPYKMRTTTPSDQTMATLLYGQWCGATLEFDPVPASVKATQLNRDLGAPSYVGAATSVNKNGEITSFSGDTVLYGYDSVSADSIETTFNFDTLGSVLILMVRIPAVVMSPWGEGSGYALYLRANGQITFTKEGTVLCEGWAPYAGLNAIDTDFTVEYGSVNVADDAVQIFAYVNGVCVLNFVDIGDTLQGSGYMVYNMGFSGSALAEGVSFPAIQADRSEIYLQESAELSCENAGESVEYFVDEERSSGKAVIDGNIITAKSPGDVYVYAISDGLYSESILIKIDGSAAAITNIPAAALTAREDEYQLEYELINGGEVTSVLFEIVEGKGTGRAELTPDGLFTPIDAGTVVVRVTVNGKISPEYTIYIKPVVYIDDTSAMAVGEVRNSSGFYANCLLPDENYTVRYELVDGEEYVDMNAMGQIQAHKIGIFWIRVTVQGETFAATSGVAGIQVEAPVVTLNGVDDMVVGERLQFYPGINKGIEVRSAEIAVLEGADCVSIDENFVVTALKSGVVKVRAVVNGYSSGSLWFQVSDLSLSIIAGDMLAADTQPLDIMFNADGVEVESVEYSIESGSEYASLADNVLVSGNRSGTVTVSVLVNGKYTAEATIDIISGVTLTGIYDDAMIPVDTVVPLSYSADRFDDVTEEKYVIVSGSEFGKIEGNKLTVTSAGKIVLKAVINGVESAPVTVLSYSAYSPIAVLSGVYDGAEFVVGSQVRLGYVYSGSDEIESVAYEIVSGGDIASVSENILTVKGEGEFSVRVVVNGIASEAVALVGYIAEDPIAVLTGIYDGIQFTVGDSALLSYAYSGADKIETVEYAILSGGGVAELEGNKLSFLGVGEVELCVTINGVRSETVTLTVIDPVVILTGGLYDGAQFFVGDRITLSYLFSGQTVASVEYEVTKGADKVSLQKNNLTILSAGAFSVRVVVNGFASDPVTVSAENPESPVAVLLGIVDGEKFAVGDQVKLSYFYSGNEEARTVEYLISEGASLAALNDGTVTFIGAGRIGIAVKVNGVLSETVYITAEAAESPEAVLLGVNNGQRVEVGGKVELSYFYSGNSAESVEYKIVSGGDCARLEGNVLTIIKAGDIRIQVVVDGVGSDEVAIVGYEAAGAPDVPFIAAVTVASVLGVALVAVIAVCIVKRKRR